MCLGMSALFYCDTPGTFHITIWETKVRAKRCAQTLAMDLNKEKQNKSKVALFRPESCMMECKL